MKIKPWLLALPLLFAVYSCGESAQQNEATENVEETETEETAAESNEPEFIIPSALQISSIFQNSGLVFVNGIANSPSNVSKYLSKHSKLLNFGAYSADLFYSVLNEQSQLSIEYLKSVRQLSEETGMTSIFNTGPLFERFEKNIGNKDSVVIIMLDFQEKTDTYIEKNNEENTAMIIFTGAWIEGMYLGLDAIASRKNEKIKARIIEQMTILPNILKGMELQPEKSAELDYLKPKLAELNDFYSNMEGVKGLDEFSFDVTAIKDADVKTLFDKIKEIRTFIVKS